MEVPASLKSIKPFLEQGKLRAESDPTLSYYCNLHALQEAMTLRAKMPKAEQPMAFIMGLMDKVEAQKAALPEVDSPQMHVENVASELFQKADDSDRSGNHGLQVAKDFLAAANIFEACKQFTDDGTLPEDLAEKSKYGKWRFVELCKAAKERRAPAPPRGMDEGPAGGDGPAEPDVPPAMPTYAPPPQDAPTYAPPPSYMDLPPASGDGGGGMPGVVPTAAAPPYITSGATPSFEAPSVPQTPQGYGGYAAAAPPPYTAAPFPQPTSIKPTSVACAEAARLCQSAASNLSFQDHVTALASLHQAIHLLTQPPPPSAP